MCLTKLQNAMHRETSNMIEVILFGLSAAMAGGCLHGILNKDGAAIEAVGFITAVSMCLLILIS